MKKREDFSKDGSKSKPFTVRFPQDFLKDIEEKRGIKNGQKIIQFLVDLYNQTFNPLVGNPVFERNALNLPKNDKERQERVAERHAVLNRNALYPLTEADCIPPNDPTLEGIEMAKGWGHAKTERLLKIRELETQIKEWEGTECPKGQSPKRFESAKSMKLISLRTELENLKA